MKLYTARGGLSELPTLHPTHIQSRSRLRCKAHFLFLHNQIQAPFHSGLRYHSNSGLRSTASEETSHMKDELKPDNLVNVEDVMHVEEKQGYDFQSEEVSWIDNPLQAFKFLEDLNIKFQFDYEETYSIMVFGGGGAVALWLAAAIVGAIDSIPVFPKVLELIGLGYTLWFTSRYLLFKKNREELVYRIEEIKQQVLGSEED